MDIKQYIQSGILELYAAGGLTESEMREVEAMAEKHPEVKSELDAIQKALTGYAGLYKKNPRPELRQTILDKIDEIEGSARVYSLSDMPAVKQTYQRAAKMRYMMAAIWAFLILNVIGNIYFYTTLKSTQTEMTKVINDNKKLQQDYQQIKNDMEKKTSDIKMVMNRNNKIVDLKGMEISPSALATVYWNPNTKQVMLNIDNLPMPPSDKQYQLWALKDGKPIDAGVFDMSTGTGGDMHMMPVKIGDADAFAVTLEKKGGSPTPDLTQLYLMGKI